MNRTTFGSMLRALISSIAASSGKKTEAIELEIGEKVGLSAAAIRHYKSGNIPPDHKTVATFARLAATRDDRQRHWVERFLRAADYPASEKLLAELYVGEHERPGSVRVASRLPVPSYSEFIPRPEALGDVVEGLTMRQAAVVILGFPGVGKSSLAIEIAHSCLREASGVPLFDEVVWITDKDREGSTRLENVLNRTARALDYPGLAQLDLEDKQHEVERLLCEHRVLIVVDNFETIEDQALTRWLLRLPGPSKALLTTREDRREFRKSAYLVQMEGMSEGEALQLVRQHAKQIGVDISISDGDALRELVRVTGGNPKAITIAMGFLREGQPLQVILDDLHNARGEVFDDLFPRAWSLLQEDEQYTLFAMTLFPGDASREMLAETTEQGQFRLTSIIQRLVGLSLLDVSQTDLNNRRYALHPLVRAFVRAKFEEHHDLELSLVRRWVDWCIRRTSQVGFCYNNLDQLELLDQDQDMIYTVIQRVRNKRWHHELIQLVDGITYYYYVRGLWDRKKLCRLWEIEAARQLNDTAKEIEALSFLITLLSRQDNIKEAEENYNRLLALVREAPLEGDAVFHYHHAIASYHMARHELPEALTSLQASLERSDEFSPVVIVDNRQWLAMCFYRMENYAKARPLFEKTLCEARALGFQRAVLFCQTYLVAIKLAEGQTGGVAEELTQCYLEAEKYKDRRRKADIKRMDARRHRMLGDGRSARTALFEAIDDYERLAMRRDLESARKELAELEADL